MSPARSIDAGPRPPEASALSIALTTVKVVPDVSRAARFDSTPEGRSVPLSISPHPVRLRGEIEFREEERMQYLALIYGEEARWANLSPEQRESEMGEYMALSQADVTTGRQRARLDRDRDDRPRSRRRDSRHRRPLRRAEGGARRLLRLRVRLDRRGLHVGREDPRRAARRDRGAPACTSTEVRSREVRSPADEQRRRRRRLGADVAGGGRRGARGGGAEVGGALRRARPDRRARRRLRARQPERRPRPSASATARRSSPTAPSPRRRSRSAA